MCYFGREVKHKESIVKRFFDVKKSSCYMFSFVKTFHNVIMRKPEEIISRLSLSET